MVTYTDLHYRASLLASAFPDGDQRMKMSPWYLLAAIPAVLVTTQGAFGAQLAVLGVTLGIFFGTLSLRSPNEGDATTTNH
jgi:cell division protein FtsW (lipid II flippase)